MSFGDNSIENVSGKIRHFYDLYYLLQDNSCKNYVNSHEFKVQFGKVLLHDQQQFAEPLGWNTKKVQDSALVKDFGSFWNKLKGIYINELSLFAFSEIPDEKEVAKEIQKLLANLANA